MDEQNKQPEQNKPEKKLSRTTLTFYIVGLFSVAIALILISYVAQRTAYDDAYARWKSNLERAMAAF